MNRNIIQGINKSHTNKVYRFLLPHRALKEVDRLITSSSNWRSSIPVSSTLLRSAESKNEKNEVPKKKRKKKMSEFKFIGKEKKDDTAWRDR